MNAQWFTCDHEIPRLAQASARVSNFPVLRGITKRGSRQSSQECCPFVQRFTIEASDPDYEARGPGELPTGVAAAAEIEVEFEFEVRGRRGFVANIRRSGAAARLELPPGDGIASLVELLRTALDPEVWDAFSRGSAIRRAGRAGFARNVCVAMGNWLATVDEPPEAAVGVLRDALEDFGLLVREHAAWALEWVMG